MNLNRDLHLKSWLALVFAAFSIATAAVMPATTPKPIRATTIDFGWHRGFLKLSHNGPKAIRQELLETNTVQLIAKSNGLSEQDLSTVQLAQESDGNWLMLNQINTPETAFKVLSEQLRNYVRARQDGHTKAFLLAAITNHVEPSTISDPDLRVIASNRIMLPLSWLKKRGSGNSTNKAGEVISRRVFTTKVDGKTVTNETKHIPQADEICRWVSYTLTDGEVGWEYFLMFKMDGSLHYLREEKCDAKEYDPAYQELIKGVEGEVYGEMKRNGDSGQLGSVHTFWRLKKQKLKTKGIEWRSPSELNPDKTYD